MGFDAKMEGYDLVEVDGRVCLFSYMRLDRNSVPEGIFCYEVEDSEREDCSFGKIKSDDRQETPDNAKPCRTCNPPCDRGGVEPWQDGYDRCPVWIYGKYRQG